MTRELRPGVVALVVGVGRGVRGRTQELGIVLARTARLVRGQPLRWLALGSLVGFPYAAVVFVDTRVFFPVLASYLVDLLWPAVLVLELTAAACGARKALGGGQFRVRASFSTALARTPPGLVLGLVVLYAYTYEPGTNGFLPVSCVAVLALLSWVLSAHVEQTTGLASSLRRTIALSRGDRIPVAMAVSVLAVGAFLAVPLATSVLLPALGRASSFDGWLLGENVARYLGFVATAVLAPLPAIAAAVAHVELKRRADGQHLARVFE